MRKITLHISADDAVVRDMVTDLMEYTKVLQEERLTGPIRIEHDEEIQDA
jgi:hypothetical protein